jgi:hypothetical protein
VEQVDYSHPVNLRQKKKPTAATKANAGTTNDIEAAPIEGSI